MSNFELPVNYDNLTQSERRLVRKQYFELQKGLCCYCNKPLNVRPKETRKIKKRLFPENFLKFPVHLHHDHDTGMTIGAIHSYCNAVVWQYFGE